MVHVNKTKLKRPSLALLPCKLNILIFELGLIAVQIEFFNFWVWEKFHASEREKLFWVVQNVLEALPASQILKNNLRSSNLQRF